MSIARLVLEYLDALKWFILAVVALVILRKPITELIDGIGTLKATVGGSSVELEARRRELERATEQAVEPAEEEILAEAAAARWVPSGRLETRGGETGAGRPGSTPEERAAAGAARGRALSPETYERVARISERRRRRDIEAVIRAAIDYGWLTGLKEPNGPRPQPEIEWTAEGKPRIRFTAVDNDEAPKPAT